MVILANNCVAGYATEVVPGSATAATLNFGLVTTATLTEDNAENSYFGIGDDERQAYKAGLLALNGSLETIVSSSVVPLLAVTRAAGVLASLTVDVGASGTPWRFIGTKFNNLRLTCGPGLDACLTSTMDFMALNAAVGAYATPPTALDDAIWAPYELTIQVGASATEYTFDTEAVSFNLTYGNNITGLPRAYGTTLYGLPIRGYRDLIEGNIEITGEIVTYEDPGVTTVTAACPGNDNAVTFTFVNTCTSGTPSNLVISLGNVGFGNVSQRITAGQPVEYTIGLKIGTLSVSGGV
jgi:hypothetical protein